MDDLRECANGFPSSSGVYIMKDEQKRILYVGKAKNLRNRVRSYFSGEKDLKTSVLVKKASTLEYIVTENEYEALVLENNLIKSHSPRYNINLKDGKSYPVVRITAEDYPRVYRTRRLVQDGSRYFGPFPSVQHLDTYLDLIERLFPLRKCRGALKKRDQPCLYHHIGRCSAPCAGLISRDDYRKQVEGVAELLSGRTDGLRADLQRRMQEAAGRMEFERAAVHRDAIRAIEELERRQAAQDFEQTSRDYLAWEREGEYCSFTVFQMRDGKLLGRHLFRGLAPAGIEDAVRQFMTQYYAGPGSLPERIFMLDPAAAEDDLKSFLAGLAGRPVGLEAPLEKRDQAVMNLARDNAAHDLGRRLHELGDLRALEDLKELFGLKKLPLRIEGFDIAQLSGKHPVASLVSFQRGAPDRKNYRHYHIKTLEGRIDDYEAVREVVARRYMRVVNEELERPDLIVIDGGRGQLGAARRILEGLGLGDTAVIGLAKQHEEIFLPDRSRPVVLPEGSPALRIIQQVRDEAHRFATGFNKKLRQKDIQLTRLEGAPGIGRRRGLKILKEFGSLAAAAEASAELIARAAGVSEEVAETVKRYLAEGEKG